MAAVSASANAECKLAKYPDIPATVSGDRLLIDGSINGMDTQLMVDSGAFFGLASPGAVAKFHMKIMAGPPGLHVRGIGGESDQVSVAIAKDFSLAGMHFNKAEFIVGEHGVGDGARILLGENFLSHFDVEYDVPHGFIRLFAPTGCGSDPLIYWAKAGQTFSEISIDRVDGADNQINGRVQLNGAWVRAGFDTGAPESIIGRVAAARAGVQKAAAQGPAVENDGIAKASYYQAWLAPFDSMKIGDEQISRFNLWVADTREMADIDMLIGLDFFLSHRVYVANSQHMMYFTYEGGPVFQTVHPPLPSAAPGDNPASANASADDHARRAASLSAVRDYTGAVAELTQAVKLEPATARYYRERGVAYIESGKPDAALSDFAQARKIAPADVDSLIDRAEVEFIQDHRDLAKADLEAARTQAPPDADAHLALADVFDRLGDRKAELAELDIWIAAHPSDDRMAETLNDRCWTRALTGQDLDKALADCNAALKLAPGDAEYLDSRGLVRLRLGAFDQSISDYDAALKLRPSEAWSLYGRGLAELRKGLKAEGDADLAAAAKADPSLAGEAAKDGLSP